MSKEQFSHELPPCGFRQCRTNGLVSWQDEPGARIHCTQCRKIFIKDAKVGWRTEGRRDK